MDLRTQSRANRHTEMLNHEVSSMYYRVYRDMRGEWRWNYNSSNGNVIADSGEGYRNKSDCLNGISIIKGSSDDPVIE